MSFSLSFLDEVYAPVDVSLREGMAYIYLVSVWAGGLIVISVKDSFAVMVG